MFFYRFLLDQRDHGVAAAEGKRADPKKGQEYLQKGLISILHTYLLFLCVHSSLAVHLLARRQQARGAGRLFDGFSTVITVFLT